MKGVTRIAEKAASALVGPSGATFIALTVVISTFGCNAAGLLAGSRVLFAMARDGVFLPAASRVHPRYRTPHVAIVALTVWSMVLALSGTYEQLFTYVMFSSILFSVAAGLALFRLRRTQPNIRAPVSRLGLSGRSRRSSSLGSRRVRAQYAVERPVESLAGLGLLASGCRCTVLVEAERELDAAIDADSGSRFRGGRRVLRREAGARRARRHVHRARRASGGDPRARAGDQQPGARRLHRPRQRRGGHRAGRPGRSRHRRGQGLRQRDGAAAAPADARRRTRPC